MNMVDIKGFIGIERLTEIVGLCNSSLVLIRESDISDSLSLPELMILQGFRLLKSLTYGKIKKLKTGLEFG